MARIPKYQQDRLASSMVGTPGVDTSTGSALQGVSSALGQVSNAIYNVAQYDYQLSQMELRRKEAETRAAMKELQNLQYETNAASTAAEVDVALNEVENQFRQQHQWDTTGGLEGFTSQSQKIVQDKLDRITDPKQKLMTEKLLQSRLSSKTQQFGDYLTGRIPEIGKANTIKIGDALRLSTNDSNLSVVDVWKKLQTFHDDPANQKAFQNVHGPAWEAEMRKFMSDASRNYLAKTAETGDLDLLNERIDKFSDILEGTDAEEFYSRQRAMAQQARAKIEKEQEYTVSVDSNERLSELRDKASRDELTAQDVDDFSQYVTENKGAPGMIRAANSALQQQNRRLLGQAKTDVEAKFTEDEKEKTRQAIVQTRKDLGSTLNSLFVKKDGKVGVRPTLADGTKVTPRMLSELYANVDEAEINGYITAESAKSMRNQINLGLRAFNKKEPQAAQHAQDLMKDSDQLMKWALKATPDPKVNKLFGVKLNNTFFDAVQKFERSKGRLSTAQERRNILEYHWPILLKESRAEYDEAQKTRKQRIEAEARRRIGGN